MGTQHLHLQRLVPALAYCNEGFTRSEVWEEANVVEVGDGDGAGTKMRVKMGEGTQDGDGNGD